MKKKSTHPHDGKEAVSGELQQALETKENECNALLEELEEARKKLLLLDRKQLVQTEKMSSLTTLVAGVAHEINTPIGIGVTAVSYFEEKTKEYMTLYREGKLTRSDLDTFFSIAREASLLIWTNLERAINLIQSFKKVAVEQAGEGERVFAVRKCVDDAILALQPRLRRMSCAVTIVCDAGLEIQSNPSAFMQIITNLVMNSLIHAFEDRADGQIDIKIEHTGEGLYFEYRDNGKGLGEEELSRIFEPFFTTKRGQGGSGLGLHVVYNLVTQTLKGDIQCKSTINEGMVFIITMPLRKEENHGTNLSER